KRFTRRSIPGWLQCESDEGLRSHRQHRHRQEHGRKPLRGKRGAGRRRRPGCARRRRQGFGRAAGDRGTVPGRPRLRRLARSQGARRPRLRRRAGAPGAERNPPSPHRPGSEEPARAARRPGARSRHLRGGPHRRESPRAWPRRPHRGDRPDRRAAAAAPSARRPPGGGRPRAHRGATAAVREGGQSGLCDRERGTAGAAPRTGLPRARQAARRVHAEGNVNGHTLVTGYPRLLARRLAESFRSRRPEGRVSVLAHEKHAEAAAGFARGIGAEVLAGSAVSTLPCTVLRPSILVGDTKTGEIDRFEGPYVVAILLVTSPLQVAVPLPGNGVAPLNVVPIDYVVSAASHIHDDERAVGRTFHLADPNPSSSRRIYELIAERQGKKLPRLSLGYRVADAILRLPGLEKLTREQRAAIAYVNHLSFFSTRGTLEILDG